MIKKILKFTASLVPSILSGEKISTWRIFDDKNLQTGDELIFINKETGKEFATAIIETVREKKLSQVDDSDFDEGHEKYPSLEDMYNAYRKYYGNEVGPDSSLKIIKYELITK